MIYKFIDVNEKQLEPCLPDEAIKFNGVWLDEVIPGYRTLQVSGRESMASEITDTDVDSRDGNIYQYTRYLPRTITVVFQLLARDSQDFRDSFNRLNALLSPEQAKIIFADEPDKYFVGTKVDIHSIPAGRNSITGEIEFYCADPIKYAVNETVISANSLGMFEFKYRGSYPAYPTLEAEMISDNGFVSYDHNSSVRAQNYGSSENSDVDEYSTGLPVSHGGILVGNPGEEDGIMHQYSETLINDVFSGSIPNEWKSNVAEPLLSSTYSVTGSVGIVGYTKYTENAASRSSAAGATDYGSGADGTWHGPSITMDIPNDSNGYAGAKSFTLKFQNYFIADSVSDLGVFQLLVSGHADGKKVIICGITFYRSSAAYSNTNCFITAGGENVKTFSFDRSRSNNVTGFESDPVEIDKYGSTVTFRYGNSAYGIELPEFAEIEATEINIFFGKRGSSSVMTNLLESLTFKKHNVDSLEDTPNLFSEGDVVSADCADGSIYVNGVKNDKLGDIENAWDEFYLRPNEFNYIHCSCSDWAERPKYTIRFREAYL